MTHCIARRPKPQLGASPLIHLTLTTVAKQKTSALCSAHLQVLRGPKRGTGKLKKLRTNFDNKIRRFFFTFGRSIAIG